MVKNKPTKLGYRLLSLLLTLSMLLSLTCIGAFADEATTVDVESIKTELMSTTYVGLDEVFSGGNGSSTDPFQISTESDLIKLQLISNGQANDDLVVDLANGAGKYFTLTADIVLTADWTPIANGEDYAFSGTFYGNSNTISGLSLTKKVAAGEDISIYGGLFGYIDNAVITNLTVGGSIEISIAAGEDSTGSTAAYAGAIAAYAVDSTLTGCIGAANISITNADNGSVMMVAGGVVGHFGASVTADDDGNYKAGTAVISESGATSAASISVATSVSGDSIGAAAGGVIGLAEGVTVSSCESAATVTVQGSETEYNTTSYKYHDDSALNQAGDATIYHDLNEYYYSNAAGGVVGAAVGLYSVETKSGTSGGGMSGGSAVASVVKECVVEDCTATAAVTNNTGTALSFAGGIMGTALFASVSDSTFDGSADGTYTGGIVAMAAGNDRIANCTLSSAASVTATNISGGIVAQLGGETASGHSGSNHADSTVTGCTTESGATVGSVDSTIYAGGIAGYVTYADSIADNTNNAAVSAKTYAGGIVAYTYGEVRESGGGAGGGSMVCYSTAVTVANCTNAGAVIVPVASSYSTNSSAYQNASAGGIIGYTQGMGDVESCTNSGTITGTNAGGIVGAIFSSEYIAITMSILNDVNDGNVNASAYAGGIIGVWYGTDTVSTIDGSSLVTFAGCLNSGNIGDSENLSYEAGYLGGIAGYLRCSIIYNCANTGNVGADTVKNNVGGIAATVLYTTIKNSYNSGSVYVTSGTTSAPTNIAGLVALLSTSGEIYNCYNAGTVSGTAKTSVSAVVGNTVATSVIQDCYALTGTQDDLTAGTKGTINAYWFDTGMNLTDSTYPSLLMALNSYVNENTDTDYELSHWWTADESYDYPVFSEDAPMPDAPETPTFTVNGKTSSGVTLNLTESVEVTAVNTTEGVYYQWYTASDASGSDMTAISGATSAEYTITDTAAVGTTYYFAAARVLGDYMYSEWTYSDPFTVTVEFATETDGSITYGDVTIELYNDGTVNSEDNPYIIDKVDKLKALSSLLTAGASLEGMYFKQNADINASAETDWTPIGTSAQPFDGIYDGGSYTVTLGIDSTEDEQALFGYNSGTIANLTVVGSVTTSGKGAAGIVFVNTGVVDNCVNTANVSAAGESYSNDTDQAGSIGGVAAYVLNGTVSNSQNSGSISFTGDGTGSYNKVGGVVGAAQGSTVTNCVNSGAVTSVARYTGGVVGYLISYSNTGYYSYLSNSGNTGAVSGGSYTGGIVGNVNNSSLVVNSYSTGSVTGSSYVGGIAGSITGTAYNCYSAGVISGDGNIGGLTASNGGEIISAYYLAQDGLAAVASGSGSASGIGSFSANGILTAEEGDTLNYTDSLFNSLQGWAIDNRNNYELLGWAAQGDGYPVLDSDVDLDEICAPYATIVLDADSNVERGATAELSATVSFDDTGDAISVTYTWYKDGAAVATGDITPAFADSNSTVIKTTADTDYPGVYTYTLRISNTNEYTASVSEESVEITVTKLASDTSWYGDTDIADGFAGGEGTETKPYLISDANELAYLAQLVNAGQATEGAYYELTCSLNLNNYTWTSIGTEDNLFTGTFNGGGYTISGLQDNSLFGYTGDAAITDLVIDGSIIGSSVIGALVNESISGTLELSNIGNNASITATASGTTSAGGLIGRVNGASTVIISGCYNAGTITSTFADTGVSAIGGGGLVGLTNGTLTITNSYNIGDIASAGTQYVGGLVASVNSTSTFSLSDSYNAGKLTGKGTVYALAGTSTTFDCTSVNCYYVDNADSPYTDRTGATAVAAVTASMLGSAFTDVGSTATFDFSHATVSINGTAVENGAAVAAAYPALAWETDPQRDAASVTFTVTADDDYGVYSVKVGDTELTPNDDGSYTVAVDEDITVTVNVKRVSWSGENDAANDIESIIASDAAGTESEDDENSTYDSSLDLNNDGKNDLLDILDILYTESAQSEDSASESTYESADSEETAAEETDEAETDSSDTATESTESTEG